jgi:hypothetical protein
MATDGRGPVPCGPARCFVRRIVPPRAMFACWRARWIWIHPSERMGVGSSRGPANGPWAVTRGFTVLSHRKSACTYWPCESGNGRRHKCEDKSSRCAGRTGGPMPSVRLPAREASSTPRSSSHLDSQRSKPEVSHSSNPRQTTESRRTRRSTDVG